ncbi:MAG: FecR family protein [Rhabdochlamydiaceae bacterium]
MPDENGHLRTLIRKYLKNQLDAEEYDELWSILNLNNDDSKHITNELQALWADVAGESAGMSADQWNDKLQRLLENPATDENDDNLVKRGKGQRIRFLYKWFVAAAVLLLIGGSLYCLFPDHFLHDDESYLLAGNEILPGGNKAFLTTASGTTISLDSSSVGLVSQQRGVNVCNYKSGHLVYRKNNQTSHVISYNTLNTPKGGQYRLTLSDGTEVWLNAASSVRFPTVFPKTKRVIGITGEVYVEVARNTSRPFEVVAGNMRINVLGTHFNVMAYGNEPFVKTTLLNGSVKIDEGDAEVQLKPGQEVRINRKGEMKLIPHADIDAAVAWKNNLFWFDNQDIKSIMQQIARWYNVDVDIRGDIKQHFTGSIPRTASVSRVFRLLKETGDINFEIQGRKVIVSP